MCKVFTKIQSFLLIWQPASSSQPLIQHVERKTILAHIVILALALGINIDTWWQQRAKPPSSDILYK